MTISDKHIIVISGLPRSGTSMLMQMIEAAGIPIASDGVRNADDDNPKGYYELEKVKEIGKSKDLSWFSDLEGRAVKIISWFLKDLPTGFNYRIIFIERDLIEVIQSQNRMLLNRGESVDPTGDAEMIKNFENHVKKIKSILGEKENAEVIYINHRSIINDSRNAAREISTFLGGHFDEAKMASAVSKDLYRNKS